MNAKRKIIVAATLFVLVLAAGIYLAIPNDGPSFFPKPKAYHRIVLPEATYETYEAACPFEFEYSTQARVMKNRAHINRPCWLNIYYPGFNATLHLTYSTLDSGIHKLTEDARNLALKHIAKANDIQEANIYRDSNSVYGVAYDFDGSTATVYQFYVTDSTNHFLRGALYFNVPPNPDSLAPIATFIKKDIERLLSTIRWNDKKVDGTPIGIGATAWRRPAAAPARQPDVQLPKPAARASAG